MSANGRLRSTPSTAFTNLPSATATAISPSLLAEGCPFCQAPAHVLPQSESSAHYVIDCPAFRASRDTSGLQKKIDNLKATDPYIASLPRPLQTEAIYNSLVKSGQIQQPPGSIAPSSTAPAPSANSPTKSQMSTAKKPEAKSNQVTNTNMSGALAAAAPYEENDSGEETFLDKLLEWILEAAPGTSGDHDDLKRAGIIGPMTIAYFAVFITTLAYFAVSGAKTISQNHFLSVEVEASNICETIPYYISSSFAGDVRGSWSTDQAFRANESMFILTFEGAAVTTEQYYEVMKGFVSNVTALGAKVATRDLAYTFLTLTNYVYTDSKTKLSLSGNSYAPTVLGSMQVQSYAISNYQGLCSPTLYKSSYDYATQNLKLTFTSLNVTDTTGIPTGSLGQSPCPQQIPDLRNLFGWKADVTGSEFSLNFDIRSLSIALGINMGIATTDRLERSELGQNITQINLPAGSFFVDPFYPNMRPIFCLADSLKGGTGTPDVCFLTLIGIYPSSVPFTDAQSVTLLYPLMQSFGDFLIAESSLGPCQCPRDKDNRFCNVADFLVELIYDVGDAKTETISGKKHKVTISNNQRTAAIGLTFQKYLIDDKINGDIKQAAAAYPLGISPSNCWYNGTYSTSAADSSWCLKNLQKAYTSVCPNNKCASILFELSNLDIFAPVNPSGTSLYAFSDVYQLDDRVVAGAAYVTGKTTTRRRLMCMDLVSFPTALESFSKKPPVQLVQPFYDCRQRFETAFLTSIGVAQGYASLAAAIFLTILGFLLVKLVNYRATREVQRRTGSTNIQAQSIMSTRKKQELKDELLIQSVKTIDKNIHALMPLLEALTQACPAKHVEEQYLLFKYNHRLIKVLGDDPAARADHHKPPLEKPPSSFANQHKLSRPVPRRRSSYLDHQGTAAGGPSSSGSSSEASFSRYRSDSYDYDQDDSDADSDRGVAPVRATASPIRTTYSRDEDDENDEDNEEPAADDLCLNLWG